MERHTDPRAPAPLFALTLALSAVGATLAPAAAAAHDDTATEREEPDDHFEVSMGFLAGGREYGELVPRLAAGDDGGLASPFGGPPFDGVTVYGLRYDVRLVVSHVRMTAGIDVPFPDYVPEQTARDADGHLVQVESLRPRALRFGIGGERAFGQITPYADLLGSIDWLRATLEVDGARARYRARGFGFSARAGVRLDLREWFFATAGAEVGLTGPVRWTAELGVGFRTP